VQGWPQWSLCLLSDLLCTPIHAGVRGCMRLGMRLAEIDPAVVQVGTVHKRATGSVGALGSRMDGYQLLQVWGPIVLALAASA
jgi:hypothetical protein